MSLFFVLFGLENKSQTINHDFFDDSQISHGLQNKDEIRNYQL
jgi:hypothetical protein